MLVTGLAGIGVASKASEGSMSACGVRDALINWYNSRVSGLGSSNSSVVIVLIERAYCLGRVSRS
jgi:hypothetical protein